MKSNSDITDSNKEFDMNSKEFLSQMTGVIEKKIKNLEKRKTKLDSHKEKIANGEVLNNDQLKAIEFYDTVVSSIALCKDFSVQIADVVHQHAIRVKEQLKIQQEKSHERKFNLEIQRIRQILKMQNVLTRLGQEDVRADFLAGANGAIKISEEDLLLIDEAYKLITPSIEDYSLVKFNSLSKSCAENFIHLLDGKETTTEGEANFKEMNNMINIISNTTYPVKKPKAPTPKSNRTANNKIKQNSEDKLKLVSVPAPVEPIVEPIAVLPAESQQPSMLSQCPPQQNSLISNGPPPGINAHPRISPADLTTRISLSDSIPHSLPQHISQTPSFYSPTSSSSLDINDLISSGSINFLQESQVQPEQPASIYNDPAIVSFGSIDGYMQIHKQKMPSNVGPPAVVPDVSNIPSENFINQHYSSPSMVTYSDSTPSMATYSDSTPSYSPAVESSAQPVPIPLPIQEEPKTTYSPPDRLQESTSWADQSAQNQEDGWGDTNGDVVCWESPEKTEPTPITSWNDEPESRGYDDYDRRSGFMRGGRSNNNNNTRGRGFGTGTNSGGYRSRGGYNSTYQNGGARDSYGGNGGARDSYRGNGEARDSYRGNGGARDTYGGNGGGRDTYGGNGGGRDTYGGGRDTYGGNGGFRGRGSSNSYRSNRGGGGTGGYNKPSGGGSIPRMNGGGSYRSSNRGMSDGGSTFSRNQFQNNQQ